MGIPSKAATGICIISKLSLKRLILLAAGLFIVSVTIDILMIHYGSHPTGFGDLIVLILALLIIFRPRWIDRWNEKNREGIENSDPDLRRWF